MTRTYTHTHLVNIPVNSPELIISQYTKWLASQERDSATSSSCHHDDSKQTLEPSNADVVLLENISISLRDLDGVQEG
jgi:hypothetical protein